MKTFQSGNDTITVPDITVVKSDNPITFRIEEGEWAGVMFTIADMQLDDKVEGLLHYSFDIINSDQSPKATHENIEKIVSNFILSILHDQVKRSKEESTATE
jgi:hypothetical protein